LISRHGKVYRVQIGDQVESVSAERLKPHGGGNVPTVAQPARRGRPPGTGNKQQPTP
jgi:hypothetical protein